MSYVSACVHAATAPSCLSTPVSSVCTNGSWQRRLAVDMWYWWRHRAVAWSYICTVRLQPVGWTLPWGGEHGRVDIMGATSDNKDESRWLVPLLMGIVKMEWEIVLGADDSLCHSPLTCPNTKKKWADIKGQKNCSCCIAGFAPLYLFNNLNHLRNKQVAIAVVLHCCRRDACLH